MDGARVFRRVGAEYVRRYHRLDIEIEAPAPSEPALFVVNHGFGAAFDLNVFAFGAAIERLNLDRPVTVLSHQLGWQFGLGPVLEYVGAQPASPESVRRAFAQGHHVAVFPGGDIDGFKSWRDRNRIKFGGRTGFAREAIDNGAPIVPIVTAGAGDSLLVLSSGEGLARAAQLDKLFRLKALPVTLSLPWGLSVGQSGSCRTCHCRRSCEPGCCRR